MVVPLPVKAVGSRKPKDTYDLNFCLENFPGGIPALAAEFAAVIDDPAVRDVLTRFASKFRDEEDNGPRDVVEVEQPMGEARAIRKFAVFTNVDDFLRAVGIRKQEDAGRADPALLGPPSRLREPGERIAARGATSAKKCAVIAVARKPAVTRQALWKSGADGEAIPLPRAAYPPLPLTSARLRCRGFSRDLVFGLRASRMRNKLSYICPIFIKVEYPQPDSCR